MADLEQILLNLELLLIRQLDKLFIRTRDHYSLTIFSILHDVPDVNPVFQLHVCQPWLFDLAQNMRH